MRSEKDDGNLVPLCERGRHEAGELDLKAQAEVAAAGAMTEVDEDNEAAATLGHRVGTVGMVALMKGRLWR